MTTNMTDTPQQKQEDFVIPEPTKQQVTGDQKFLFLIVSAFTASIPLYLYHNIFGLRFGENIALIGVVTFFSTLILTNAFRNVATSLQRRMTNARNWERALEGKKGSLKKAEDSPSSREATAFSILYNSVVFQTAFIALAFYVFRSASGPYNYVVSVSLASAITSIFSASQV